MTKEKLYTILKRLFSSLLILFFIITLVFVLIRISPGDPSQKYISPKLSPELAQEIRKSFGLDAPIFIQYINFLKNIFTGDFGISYEYRMPVLNVVAEFLPVTIMLAFLSILIQLIVGYYTALFSIRRKNFFIDNLFRKISLLIYVTPGFVLGLILVFIFTVQLDILPSGGFKSFYYDELSLLGQLGDIASHLILPLLTLSLPGAALFFNYFRDGIEDVMSKDFILYLKASGFSDKVIFRKHILPNSLKPILSGAGIELGYLLSGTLVTEVIFSLPGMGRLMINSILNRDFPMVIACAFISALFIILSNFIFDLIKVKIDRRIWKEILS
ncbi:Peptide/nickel transport system permease protein [Ignavibacterium album JCM 16511]|uniref:Peptide/nickel transport system permease protein n=1 Tax=Ignavibacterium album (strain DSM 19864 / JCM 16511 / NBRC 101810 / Mat9-16) TaxID=945713 RepID=I0AGI9_IGNAJ|nr:ABC transporter permease [Ignavibacterium album]AFH48096.1 Peptide/nickel transport system permease protein [Ignavibacterium album JCM 16511]